MSFQHIISSFELNGQTFKFYDLARLGDPRLQALPFSVRVLLQSAIRNCDDYAITKSDIEKILDWKNTSLKDIEIPFKPARVVLQDFTGVPLVVDLAAMRQAFSQMGVDPKKVNPLCPVDLVVDHSIQVDFARSAQALRKNEEKQFERNVQRFGFLKWGQSAFDNFRIIPPGSGIVHQVNLEYLARVAMEKDSFIFPDSVVGTDSHTTMINGLGVLGWGVGGIQAQANMLGQCTSMTLPQVVGFKLTGNLPQHATATDLVLTCTMILRKRGVVEKFVQFFGAGVKSLSLADRATVSNMAPEYGATIGYFPPDEVTLQYLQQTGRSKQKVQLISTYLKQAGLLRNYDDVESISYSGEILQLDLSTVEPSVAGPKRPHDFVKLSDMKGDWSACLKNAVGFKGFGVQPDKIDFKVPFKFQQKQYFLSHGSVVIAAITSCTNTSNPGVMLAAGLICKKAVQLGLRVKPYIKTSLSPGSQVVQSYYQKAGLLPFMQELGFSITGYGCMTCIGNSGQINPQLETLIKDNDLVAASVLSGNRNFEGRVHPATRANYLASPPLVVCFALAGTVDIDFSVQALGTSKEGKQVFLKDLWPSRKQLQALQKECISPQMFRENYQRISKGTTRWNSLEVPKDLLFKWDPNSTYIHLPPFFQHKSQEVPPLQDIKNARVLALFGDSITTDHISPAGNISVKFSAAKYLRSKGVTPENFNSYGARRGNDQVMSRGTFSNVRILNKMMEGQIGPFTKLQPQGTKLQIFEAAEEYKRRNQQVVLIGGKEYGSGSSRDWAAKGPFLLGVKAVIAQSFERIHRSNLVGMGILPLQFLQGQSASSLKLTGKQRISIQLQGGKLSPGQQLKVVVEEKEIRVRCRVNTEVQMEYLRHGGILPFVLRKLSK